MKNYSMFNYDYLFGDHFATVSDQAKMLYVKMNFYANAGFVANPKSILDSLGYDKYCLQELLSIDEILMIPNRAECFITSYFVHNPTFDKRAWTKSPFAPYWKGKIWFKENGIATLKQPKDEETKAKLKTEKPKISDKESNDKDIYIEHPTYDVSYDYSIIPEKWNSNDISKGMKLKIRKAQGERLDIDEEKYLAAFLDKIKQNENTTTPQPTEQQENEFNENVMDDPF